jgi:hypothetical protein
MISGQQAGVAEVSGIDGIKTMGMKVTGKSFGLLIDKLYTRKEDAVVREIGSNARDAMVMAGKADQPFHIHLPSDISHELIFQDFGPGLSVDDVHKYLGNLFESSKDNENLSIGSYGLGSKSPFCVTDSYAIESIHGGQKHFFSFFRAKGSTPNLVHLSSESTDEPNGIIFRIPTPPARYSKYLDSIRSQMMLFSPRPKVFSLGEELKDVWSAVEVWKNPHAELMIVENYSFYNMYSSTAACMGGVLYPLSLASLVIDNDDAEDLGYTSEEIAKFNLWRNLYSTLSSVHGSTMVFNFNIGDLEIPPSRESIEYDTRSSINIIKVVHRVIEETSKNTLEDIEKVAKETNGWSYDDALKKVLEVLNAKEFEDKTRSSYKTGIYDAVKRSDKVKFRVKYGGYKAPTKPYPIAIKFTEDHQNALAMFDGYVEITLSNLLSRNDKGNVNTPLLGSPLEFTERLSVDDGYYEGMALPPEINLRLTKMAGGRGNVIGAELVGYKIEPNIILDHPGPEPTEDDAVKKVAKGYRVTATFKGTHYEVKYKISSGSVKPSGDRVTPFQMPFVEMHDISTGEMYVRYGASRTTYILVDDENEIYKKAGWLMKCDAEGAPYDGSSTTITDDQINRRHSSQAAGEYKFVRSKNNDFSELFEVLEGNPRHRLVRLSKVATPKLTKSIPMDIIRGLRHLNTVHTYNGSTAFVRSGYFNQFTTVKPPEDGVLPKRFFVYGDGNTESVYMDPELKVKVSIGEVSALVDLYYKMSKDKMAVGVYRLSPSLTKKREKFIEMGCVELKGAIEQSLPPDKFRNKLKRQYVRYLLSNSTNKTYPFLAGGEDVNKLLKMFPKIQYRIPNVVKMIKRFGKRQCSYAILNWVVQFNTHYGKMTKEECFAMAIVGLSEHEKNERGEDIKIIRRDFVKMVKKVRKTVNDKFMEYFKAHPIEVLNSEADRNSAVFDLAVEIAKQALKKV